MKATLNANALIIQSAVTVEQIKKLKKLKPEALVVFEKNEDTKAKTPVFMIGLTPGCAMLDNTGILFDGATRDEHGYATATLMFPTDAADPKEAIADVYGVALTRLKAWEESTPAVIESVEADRAALLSSIEV